MSDSGREDRDSGEVTIVQPEAGRLFPDLKEAWRYRELLYFLIGRDVKIKYRQTIVGVAWVVLQPILTSAIFSIIFGRFFKLSSGGSPYSIFVFCALLPWIFFANSISRSVEGYLSNRSLVTKIYFPRLLLPLSIVVQNLIDFFISVITLVIIMAIFKIDINAKLFFLPFFLLLVLVLSIGVSLWLSALNVKYRDMRHIVPFLLQVLFYCTPVAYAFDLVPSRWSVLYALNPMVGIIEGFRWCFLGNACLLSTALPLSIAVISLIFVFSLAYFARAEKTFADII